MLIILAGLPGTGKTTIARQLAREAGAVHLRIDTIEHAIREAGAGPVIDVGYRVGYALAEDNLRLGRIVIADSVNPIALTRAAWRAAAQRAGAPVLEVEIMCSDPFVHRARVESRETDIEGFKAPTWAEVEARVYEPWTGEHMVIDTARMSATEAAAALRARVGQG